MHTKKVEPLGEEVAADHAFGEAWSSGISEVQGQKWVENWVRWFLTG